MKVGYLRGWVEVGLGVAHIHGTACRTKMAGDGLVSDVRKKLGHLGCHWGSTARAHNGGIVVVGHAGGRSGMKYSDNI